MLVTLKGKQNYFLTDEEGMRVAENLEKKKITFIKRLGGLMISEFQIDYFGPVNQDFVGKEIYADANGIFYYYEKFSEAKKVARKEVGLPDEDGEWYFWHLLPTPEEYRSSMDKYKEAMDYIMKEKKRVHPEQDCLPELRNRAWVRVGEYDEMAVIPVDDYLRLKFTNDLALESLRDAKLLTNEKKNLPAIISSELKLIGTNKRLAREENHQRWHKRKTEEFRVMSIEEKIKAYDELGWVFYYDGNSGKKEFAEEFKNIFLQMHGKDIEEHKRDSSFCNF